MADGVAAQNVARWDGTAWSSVGAGLPGTVFSLAADVTGRLYAGGQVVFTVAAWNGEEWTVIGGSELGVYVGALLLDGNGNLYAGGAFASLAGVAANNVARWDGAAVTHVDHTGDLPASFRPSPAYPNPFNPETHFTLLLAAATGFPPGDRRSGAGSRAASFRTASRGKSPIRVASTRCGQWNLPDSGPRRASHRRDHHRHTGALEGNFPATGTHSTYGRAPVARYHADGLCRRLGSPDYELRIPSSLPNMLVHPLVCCAVASSLGKRSCVRTSSVPPSRSLSSQVTSVSPISPPSQLHV